jgi:hypothetical protein
MATKNPLTQDAIIGNTIYTWTLASGDDGAPVGFPGSGDRTVQVEGTFGTGGTLLIEGTLNGTSWYTLRDPSGVALSFSSANLKTVLEHVVSIRPRVNGGDGSTSITVIISVRRDRNG